MGCVYVATNRLNGKIYVGQTIQTLERRMIEHRHAAVKGNDTHFYRAIRRYGFDSFNWEVVFESGDREILRKVEILTIEDYQSRSPFGYNQTKGGSGGAITTGMKHSEEAKMRISESLRGLKRSQETRDRIREVRLGTKASKETREKMSTSSKARVRKPLSLETRAKISAALLGRTWVDLYGEDRANQLKLQYSLRQLGNGLGQPLENR